MLPEVCTASTGPTIIQNLSSFTQVPLYSPSSPLVPSRPRFVLLLPFTVESVACFLLLSIHARGSECDEKVKKAIGRILNIWQERAAYPVDFLNSVRTQVRGTTASETAATDGSLSTLEPGPPVDVSTIQHLPLP